MSMISTEIVFLINTTSVFSAELILRKFNSTRTTTDVALVFLVIALMLPMFGGIEYNKVDFLDFVYMQCFLVAVWAVFLHRSWVFACMHLLFSVPAIVVLFVSNGSEILMVLAGLAVPIVLVISKDVFHRSHE